jgi:hypothetical protein
MVGASSQSLVGDYQIFYKITVFARMG